ncbi:MAG: STAS domain-containing protein [Planctomycetaceae bacterium]
MFPRTRQGVVDVVHGTVPLNQDAESDFSAALETCLSKGGGQVVVDLREVSLIDSVGLETLVETQERCLRRGGALKIAAANALCRDVLRVTGVDEQIEVYSDVVAAVGSFAE